MCTCAGTCVWMQVYMCCVAHVDVRGQWPGFSPRLPPWVPGIKLGRSVLYSEHPYSLPPLQKSLLSSFLFSGEDINEWMKCDSVLPRFPSESLAPNNHVSLPSSSSHLFGFGDCFGGRGLLFCFVLISNQVHLVLLRCARMWGIHWSLGILPSTKDTPEPKPLGWFCPKKHHFFFLICAKVYSSKTRTWVQDQPKFRIFPWLCPVHPLYLTSLHLAQSSLDTYSCLSVQWSV